MQTGRLGVFLVDRTFPVLPYLSFVKPKTSSFYERDVARFAAAFIFPQRRCTKCLKCYTETIFLCSPSTFRVSDSLAVTARTFIPYSPRFWNEIDTSLVCPCPLPREEPLEGSRQLVAFSFFFLVLGITKRNQA